MSAKPFPQAFDQQVTSLPLDPHAFLNAEARGGAVSGKESLTISEAALRLVGGEPGWSDALGVGFTVTYGFRADAPARMPDDAGGFSRFNASQIAIAELALQGWSDVANIRFERVGVGTSGEGAFTDAAIILLGNYSTGVEGASALGFYPGSTNFGSIAGDVWVNSTLGYNITPTIGGYGGMVLVHELGHAIGLAHPSDYDASDATSPTYADSADYAEDSRQYTVMSYFSETNTGGGFGGTYSAAPMLDDIAAAQLEYGANTTTRLTDTIYGFNANAGRPWFEATSSNAKLVFAAWDAGGVDTFDFSGFSQDQVIDLRPGFFSSVGGLSGNVVIAIGAVIENAVGGSGSDQIFGNSAANRLFGGPGNDVLDGGEGPDTAIFSAAQASYRWVSDASGWRVSDLRTGVSDGVDTLRSIEFLKFSDATVRLVSAALVLEPSVSVAITNLLRVSVSDVRVQNLTNELAQRMGEGSVTDAVAISSIVKAAGATTSVATLSYEFFTGKIPTQSGIDYLVSPTGPNINNLNSAYYQNFNIENRYINFAVNLGKFGEGKVAFESAYGALSLFDATRQAYATIFGAAPTDTKLHDLLEASFVLNNMTMTRADYFAAYGQDGVSGLGAKAAMVGWLLAEGQKADVGLYARANEAFLQDLADGAAFGVDLIGVYGKADYIYTG